MKRSFSVGHLSTSFYDKIGRPKFVAAPMVAHSELAFRLLYKKNGVDLGFSQMLNSKGFGSNLKQRQELMDWCDYQHISGSQQLTQDAMKLDTPLVAQFCGNDVKLLVEAGRCVENSVSAIDLNLGCPQGIARTGNYGAYLLKKPKLIQELLSAMVKEINCPITAKIRLLSAPNSTKTAAVAALQDTIELAQMIESCGVQMLTVHGRTIEQNKQFCGTADWDAIAEIKRSVNIPVVANGGVENYASALKCLEHTGVDSVMSSEALLENPKLFSQIGSDNFQHHYAQSQLITVREYIQLSGSYVHTHKTTYFHKPHLNKTKDSDNNNNSSFSHFNRNDGSSTSNCSSTNNEENHLESYKTQLINDEVKSHLFKLMYRFIQAPQNHDIRALLVAKSTMTLQDLVNLVDVLEARMCKMNYETEKLVSEGFLTEKTWYNRYRNSGSVGSSGDSEQ